jgi:hypothetical protein
MTTREVRAKLLVTQVRWPLLGGRNVPRDFLPVAGMTTGCLNEVVGLTDDMVPVCKSGSRRVTAGDALKDSCRVTPPGSCCVGFWEASSKEGISGAGVVGPDALFDAWNGIGGENRGLLSGKGSCSAGESWWTSPGTCNPEALC